MAKVWLEKILLPLAVAAIALIGAFGGTILANSAATRNQVAAFAEQRAQTERDKRGDAYIRFLDATNKLARAITVAHQCRSEQGSTAGCDPAIANVKSALDELANSVNIVHVYGSSPANDRMNSVLELLPPIYPINESDITGAIEAGINANDFARRLTEFQRNMCMELPANPRTDC